jgi:hypothetical protein
MLLECIRNDIAASTPQSTNIFETLSVFFMEFGTATGTQKALPKIVECRENFNAILRHEAASNRLQKH